MNGRVRRALLITLGCAKNLVDSEHMAAALAAAGYRVEAAAEPPAAGEAEVAVVNTCGFIAPARAESLGAIRALARWKKEGRLGRLVVAGCLAQREAARLLRRLPAVDAVVGTGDFPRLGEVLARLERGEGRLAAVGRPEYRYDGDLPRLRLHPGPSAYVKIAEGCDHACAFCAIPALRGRYRSRPPEAVAEEVAALAAAGVREVNLVAQDCAAYGLDLAGRQLLPDLLRRLDAVPGLRWVRLLYNHPATFTPALAAAMAAGDRVCAYVDLPMQHGSDRILAAMGRGGGREFLLRRLAEVRALLPGAAVRSSFIVGFPGETEADFRALLSFLREAALDYAGFFAFSPEEGTRAAALPRQVAEETKERRLARAMALQARVSLGRNRERVGRVLEVLVEGEEPGEPGCYRGRWRGQAPEVDGQVFFSSPVPLAPGDLVPVRITWAEEYDLHGVAAGAPAAAAAGPVPGARAAGRAGGKQKAP